MQSRLPELQFGRKQGLFQLGRLLRIRRAGCGRHLCSRKRQQLQRHCERRLHVHERRDEDL